MALKTRLANPDFPVKMVICGPPGIGKTTLGAKATNPVFLPLEQGAEHVTDAQGRPVEIIEGIKTLADVEGAIADLMKEKHKFQTLVVDSADWMEKVVHGHILKDEPTKSIITVKKGFGAGFSESAKIHTRILNSLEDLSRVRNMNIVITAHVDVKTAKDPSATDDYDYYEMKCHKDVSSMWREWSDAFLFARKPVFTKSSDDTVRARAFMDETRICYTQETAFFKAKNRYGLPKEMPFTENFWIDFSKCRKPRQAVTVQDISEVKAELEKLYAVVPEELKAKVFEAIKEAGEDLSQLRAIVERLKTITGR